MKEVAYGITEKFDMPSELIAWGEIRGKDSNLCIDSMGHKGIVNLKWLYFFCWNSLTEFWLLHWQMVCVKAISREIDFLLKSNLLKI